MAISNKSKPCPGHFEQIECFPACPDAGKYSLVNRKRTLQERSCKEVPTSGNSSLVEQ